jgi:hypothetical protein
MNNEYIRISDSGIFGKSAMPGNGLFKPVNGSCPKASHALGVQISKSVSSK